MATTLAQLRILQTKAVIRARIAAALAAAGQPVAQWTPAAFGGVENAVLDAAAGGLAKVVAPAVVQQTEMRLLDLASGDGLRLYAKKRYLVEANDATYTIVNIKLATAPASPAYDFQPGELWMQADSGNLYQSIDPVDLPPGTVGANCRFQAEKPGLSYNDGEGTITRMVTAPAGVSGVNRPPAQFAPTALNGSSTGTVTGAFSTSDPQVGSIRVRIDQTGNVGDARYSVSTDGGATWAARGPVSVTTVVDKTTLTFVDGVNPSFVQGDILTMVVADAILQRGTDDEGDESIKARCRLRWSSLSDVPTEGLVVMWARRASPEIARVRVDADPNSPGGMLLQVASQTGPASPAAVIAVQDYVTARLRGYKGMSPPPIVLPNTAPVGNAPTEMVQASSAVPFPVTVASNPKGAVVVQRQKLQQVQAAADENWNSYLGQLDIGGVIVYAELIQAIMDAGATDAIGVQLNGGTVDVQMGVGQVAVPAANVSITRSLAWQVV